MNITPNQLASISRSRDIPKPLQIRDVALHHFRGISDGEATFSAIKNGVDSLVALAPADHDVLVTAFGIAVHSISMRGNSTLVFMGFDGEGSHTNVISHFSQVVATVVYVKRKEQGERIITGFYQNNETGA